MSVPAEKSRVIRFGVFEVDLQETELRKHGLRIKLQDQPFQILTLLLERPGETVTRNDLRQKLWPADTFVDFDHSLNSSIKKLREALGDDSENPRFIETLHRRGYRFIASISESDLAIKNLQPKGQLVTGKVPKSHLSPATRYGLIGLGFAILATTVLGFWLRSSTGTPRVVGSKQITSDALAKLSIATDGNQVYFNEIAARNLISTAQVRVGGGEAATLSVPFLNAEIADICSEPLHASDLQTAQPAAEGWLRDARMMSVLEIFRQLVLENPGNLLHVHPNDSLEDSTKSRHPGGIRNSRSLSSTWDRPISRFCSLDCSQSQA